MTSSNVFTSLAEWTKRRSAGTDLFTYYGWFLTTFNFIRYDLGDPVIEQPFSLRWSRIYGPCYVRGGDFKAKISWLLIFCINHPPLKECLQPWSGRASMTSIISWAEGRLRSSFDKRFSFCLLLFTPLLKFWNVFFLFCWSNLFTCSTSHFAVGCFSMRSPRFIKWDKKKRYQMRQKKISNEHDDNDKISNETWK